MKTLEASCACGKVRLEARGAPIVSAVCHCDHCQEGGRRIEALPHAPPVRDPFGGTPYLTYRGDRFAVVAGAELLEGMTLSDKAPTTRFVARCCNSGMYLKFAPGWWVSLYRARFGDDAPPLTMRTQTKNVPAGVDLPKDLPAYRGFPFALLSRLLGARIAMALGR